MRTLSEILIEADTAKGILQLKKLSEELYHNKQHYPLHEVIFGLEHIKDLGLAIKAKDTIEQMFQ